MPDNKLTILIFGDIIGKIGRKVVTESIQKIKQSHDIDLIIANAENLAHGIGATPKTIETMKEIGIDAFTSGNHIFKKVSILPYLDDPGSILIRPANYIDKPGKGILKIGAKGLGILLINLQGQVFIEEETENPFKTFDTLYSQYKNEADIILVDFHAEVTSEKEAMAWYADGRATAVWGTHAHIPTADAGILTKGTARVSDVGMSGYFESVIGANKDVILKQFLTGENQSNKFELPDNGLAVSRAILLTIDIKTKRVLEINRIDSKIEIE